MKECLEHKGYLGSVEFDVEENLLHGEVIGIRDVVTFEGASVDELRHAFQESVDDYLDYCKQRGEKPDKPWSGRFVVRITSDLHRDLSLTAVRAGVSLNTFVSDLLARGIGGHVGRKESRVRSANRTAKAHASAALLRAVAKRLEHGDKNLLQRGLVFAGDFVPYFTISSPMPKATSGCGVMMMPWLWTRTQCRGSAGCRRKRHPASRPE